MTLLDVILYFVMPLAITALMTYGLIPYFHLKQFGQYIREEGPKAHLKKQGTPTMGGIAIFIGIAAGMAIFMFGFQTRSNPGQVRTWCGTRWPSF